MPLPPTRYEFGDAYFITDRAITQMQSSVFPLVVTTPSSATGVGTAFCVAAAGVLATARHVVEDARRVIKEAGGGQLHAVWYGDTPGHEDGIMSLMIPITDACTHPDRRFDFALLTAAEAWVNDERVHMPSLELDFALPQVGDEVVMMGYTAFRLERPTPETLSIDQPLSLSRGHVKDVHPEARDSVNAPFPCFGTDARCDAGMSGGPALRIDDSGRARVVGLNIIEIPSNSIEHVPQASSFAAALQTLLPMEVVMVGESGERKTRTLLDLGQNDYLVSPTEFGAWTLERDPAGVMNAVRLD